jgi:hypothetical protein
VELTALLLGFAWLGTSAAGAAAAAPAPAVLVATVIVRVLALEPVLPERPALASSLLCPLVPAGLVLAAGIDSAAHKPSTQTLPAKPRARQSASEEHCFLSASGKMLQPLPSRFATIRHLATPERDKPSF